MNEEMNELKTIVSRTLETKGVLGTIRAQLRAAVFTALDEQERSVGKYVENSKSKLIHATTEGNLLSALIREYLEFYDLDHTLSVYIPESGATSSVYKGRSVLADQLNLESNREKPLLLDVLHTLLEKSDNNYVSTASGLDSEQQSEPEYDESKLQESKETESAFPMSSNPMASLRSQSRMSPVSTNNSSAFDEREERDNERGRIPTKSTGRISSFTSSLPLSPRSRSGSPPPEVHDLSARMSLNPGAVSIHTQSASSTSQSSSPVASPSKLSGPGPFSSRGTGSRSPRSPPLSPLQSPRSLAPIVAAHFSTSSPAITSAGSNNSTGSNHDGGSPYGSKSPLPPLSRSKSKEELTVEAFAMDKTSEEAKADSSEATTDLDQYDFVESLDIKSPDVS